MMPYLTNISDDARGRSGRVTEKVKDGHTFRWSFDRNPNSLTSSIPPGVQLLLPQSCATQKSVLSSPLASQQKFT